jgi:hypothetical protein
MRTFKQFIKESKLVGIYPHGQGSDVHPPGGNGNGEVSNHNIQHTVGNEPFKDKTYFRRPPVKLRINQLRKAIAKTANRNNVPPVLGTSHPADPKATAVVDGNHRLKATKTTRQNTIPVQNVPHHNVHLMPDYSKIDHSGDTSKKIKNHGVPLSTFRELDGSYDMHREREELGGHALKHYFVNPDGTHNFKDPRK